MKIAVLSDSHDHTPLLRAAVHMAMDAGAQALLHCGDLVAVSTLEKVYGGEIPMHVIYGNNIGDPVALTRLARGAFPGVQYHGQDAALTLGDRRVFIVHYPHYAHAMAATGVVALPGMMTGQILAGVEPTEAVRYQLLVMFLIAGATGTGVLLAVFTALWRLGDDRPRWCLGPRLYRASVALR